MGFLRVSVIKTLSEHQLLMMHDEANTQDQHLIENEWQWRYALNYPYKLDIHSNIVDATTGFSHDDRDVSKRIKDQANLLRGRRSNARD